jgi:hypothetical protein
VPKEKRAGLKVALAGRPWYLRDPMTSNELG